MFLANLALADAFLPLSASLTIPDLLSSSFEQANSTQTLDGHLLRVRDLECRFSQAVFTSAMGLSILSFLSVQINLYTDLMFPSDPNN